MYKIKNVLAMLLAFVIVVSVLPVQAVTAYESHFIFEMQTDPNWNSITSATAHPIMRGTNSAGAAVRISAPLRELQFPVRNGTSQGLRIRAGALLNALSSEGSKIQIEYSGRLSVAGASQIRMEQSPAPVWEQGVNIWTAQTGDANVFTQTITLTREQLQHAVNVGTGDITLGATPANAELVITGIRIIEISANETAPIETAPVTTWVGLHDAINAAPYGEPHTIKIGASFASPLPHTLEDGREIVIPHGRDITIVSDDTTERVLTQAMRHAQRHFIVGNSILTLGQGITLCVRTDTVEAFSAHDFALPQPLFSSGAGGVTVHSGGGFTMNYGSTIRNAAMVVGGAVSVHSGGIFEMNEGSIIENSHATSGGAVGVSGRFAGNYEPAVFNMNGGIIRNNTAHGGGGINVRDNGIFNMHGGNITNNHASSRGGGVFASGVNGEDFVFTMTGGTITNNTAGDDGGGIFFATTSPVNMYEINTSAVTGNTPNNINDIFYPIYDMQTDPNWASITSATAHPLMHGTNSVAAAVRISEPSRELHFPTRSGTSQGLRIRANALLNALCEERSGIRIEYSGRLNVAGNSQVRMEQSPAPAWEQGVNIWTQQTGWNNTFSHIVTLTREQLQHATTTGTGDITLGATPANAELTITNITISAIYSIAPEPEQTPEPSDMPYIRVLTEFPGRTTLPAIDIEYIATPGEGEYITSVSFTKRGRTQYIYVSGTLPGREQRGILGEARIPVAGSGGSDGLGLVFTVRDSAGNEATFRANNTPSLCDTTFFDPPCYIPDESLARVTSREDASRDMMFVTDRLWLRTGWDGWRDGTASLEAVQAAAATIGGTVIGFSSTGGVHIQLSDSVRNDEDLQAIGEALVNAHPHLFDPTPSRSYLIVILQPRLDTMVRRYAAFAAATFPHSQWWLDDTNFPKAWEEFFPQMSDNSWTGSQIRVGVLDSGGFRYSHEALQVPSRNIINRNQRTTWLNNINQSHGTAVMSILGGRHSTLTSEVAGGININRNFLFGYDAHCQDGVRPATVVSGLRHLVQGQNVQVVNVSLGHPAISDSDVLPINEEVGRLLDNGFDFVIVQAAGNERNHKAVGSFFRDMNETNFPAPSITGGWDAVNDRIITVGATNENGRMWLMSNFGVNVVAPGTSIRFACNNEDDAYDVSSGLRNGTSLAAPIVSALAALIFDYNPDLSGACVKRAIVNSAVESGLPVEDNRIISFVRRNTIYHQIDAYAALRYAAGDRMPRYHANGILQGQVLVACPSDSPFSCTFYPCPYCRPLVGMQIKINALHDDVDFIAAGETNHRGFYRITDIPVQETGWCPITGIFRCRSLNFYELTFYPMGPYYYRYYSGRLVKVNLRRGVNSQINAVRLPSRSGASANVFDEAIGFAPFSGDITLASEPGGMLGGRIYKDGELFEGTATLRFYRGIYLLEPHMLYCEEWASAIESLAMEPVKTVRVTDGHFHAQLPPGNYTVILSGGRIYTEVAHVIAHWDGDDYWLNQNIIVRRREPRNITYAFECELFLNRVLQNYLGKQPGDPVYDYEVADIRWLCVHEGATSIAGIEYFTSLQSLCAIHGSLLSTIDVSHNRRLLSLSVGGNLLTSLDLSRNRQLLWLNASNNSLTHITLPNSMNLSDGSVSLHLNNIPSLDYVIGWEQVGLSPDGLRWFYPQRHHQSQAAMAEPFGMGVDMCMDTFCIHRHFEWDFEFPTPPYEFISVAPSP
ncbi:MAG: S8 family serine peptidase [Defluviitaleaceae bacterium]|nr:S8 family serine peptidase [Defluviitaleaceae bacterium]MCL2262643.1 S8 family serine peptidase [Defluviitaleaceae bacterium]